MIPPRPASRPTGLLLTSLLCIVVGWIGIWGAYREVSFYHADSFEETPAVANLEPEQQAAFERYVQTERQARDQARAVRLPIAVANMLLSALLVVAATRVFGGRPGARSLALQSLGANGLLCVADYVLSRPLRQDRIPALAEFLRSVSKPPPGMAEAEIQGALTSALWTGFRLQFLLTLALYVASLIALSTDRARAYLDADKPLEEA